MFKICGLLNRNSVLQCIMLKAFLGLQTTAKRSLTNIPSDIQWYTTMMKVAISIVNTSNGMKCHTIKQKFVNKSLYFAQIVKKSLQF